MAIHKVIGTLGDINPLDYDGGFVFLHAETNEPEIEYYCVFPDPDDESDTSEDKITVHRCLVEPYDWVDWKAVARSCGYEPDYYDSVFSEKDPLHMAMAIEDAACYYGWFEFDQYPLTMNRAEAEERIERLFGKE